MLILGLGIIAAGLIFIGLLYAYIIYHRPIDRTWVEVLIGASFTLAGEMVARALIYYVYGLLGELWWTLPIPFICFGLTGVPMIAFQEYKYRTQKHKGEEVENQFNGERY